MPVGRQRIELTDLRDDWKEHMFHLSSKGASISELAESIGVSRDTFYTLIKRLEEFKLVVENCNKLRVGKRRIPTLSKHIDQLEKRRKVRDCKKEYKSNAVACSMRSMLGYHLRKNGMSKMNKKTFEILGYTTGELKSHLSKLFTKGMSFDNYGDWHVDHITPVSWFDLTNKDEFNKCWSLSNLKPMWAQENISKGNRYSEAQELNRS